MEEDHRDAEIRRLKERVKQLESENAALRGEDETDASIHTKDTPEQKNTISSNSRAQENKGFLPLAVEDDTQRDLVPSADKISRKRKRSSESETSADANSFTTLTLKAFDPSEFVPTTVLSDVTNIRWSENITDALPKQLVIVLDPELAGHEIEVSIPDDRIEALELLRDVPALCEKYSEGKYGIHKLAYIGVLLSNHCTSHEVVFCEGTAFLEQLENWKPKLGHGKPKQKSRRPISKSPLQELLEESGIVFIGPVAYLKQSDKMSNSLRDLRLYSVYYDDQLIG